MVGSDSVILDLFCLLENYCIDISIIKDRRLGEGKALPPSV